MEPKVGAEGFFEIEDDFLVAEDDGFDGADGGRLEWAGVARAGRGRITTVEGVVNTESLGNDFAIRDGFDIDGRELGVELAAFAKDGPEDELVVVVCGSEEDAGFAHEGAAFIRNRRRGVGWVTIFE